jgi:hypothetical protein
MPDIKGTTRAQTKFLRSFRKCRFSPNVEEWPSPAVLRRWMRRPRFVMAMRGVRDALRYQADFQLLSAAAAAAHILHTSVCSSDHEQARIEMKAFADLMKLAHTRERFAKPDPEPQVSDASLLASMRAVHPSITVQEALQLMGLAKPEQDGDR